MTEKTRRYFESAYKLSYVNGMGDKVGRWKLPALPPCHVLPKGFVGFDQIKKDTPRDLTVHFHCWDDQEERFWLKTEKYLPLIDQFASAVMPDFSTFTDMAPAENLRNLYRSRVLARKMIDYGIIVLPSATWWDEESVDICLEGLPIGSLLEISNVGTSCSENGKRIFRYGVNRVMEMLKPSRIVLYGHRPDETFRNIPYEFCQNTHYSGTGMSYLNHEQLQLKEVE